MAQCTATSKRSGKRCEKSAAAGATVCRMHGGAAGQVKAAAERRHQDATARQAVMRYALPVDIDPHDALLGELKRTHGWVLWLEQQVNKLEDHELHGPVGGSEHGYPRHEPHVWYRTLHEERRHLARVAFDCIRAGIAEAQIALAKAQADLIVTYTKGLLTELGIDPGSEKARVAVRKHLSLIAALPNSPPPGT